MILPKLHNFRNFSTLSYSLAIPPTVSGCPGKLYIILLCKQSCVTSTKDAIIIDSDFLGMPCFFKKNYSIIAYYCFCCFFFSYSRFNPLSVVIHCNKGEFIALTIIPYTTYQITNLELVLLINHHSFFFRSNVFISASITSIDFSIYFLTSSCVLPHL